MEKNSYLGLSSAKNINHDLHDSLVHTQCSHQVRVLVEDFIFHDIPKEERVLHFKHISRSKVVRKS